MENNEEENSTQQQPAFKPARNPFLGGFMGQKNQNTQAEQVETKEVEVAGKSTTLVGNTAEKKAEIAGQDNSEHVPEEILYQWQAPEFVYTEKPFGWFLAEFAFFIGLATLAFFFINSPFQKWVTIGLLLIMAVAVSVWAKRKPRICQYTITNYGIQVNDKKFPFDDFRAYYTYNDYNQSTIDLVPGKRFGTLVSMPLATPEAEDVEETIAHMVPKIEHNEDFIDKIFRRIRF